MDKRRSSDPCAHDQILDIDHTHNSASVVLGKETLVVPTVKSFTVVVSVSECAYLIKVTILNSGANWILSPGCQSAVLAAGR
jgi:hypothetical protein